MDQIVIVGAGQAAASAAAKLRALGHDGPVTVLGAEAHPPYQRPPLSKAYLSGEMALGRLYLRPAEWYAEHGIDLRTGVAADRIDPGARVVEAGGEALAYDALLLATGAAPRRLPAAIGGDLAGVLTMRDLADADAMGGAVGEGTRMLVVGGGYIGLEAAAVAIKRGASVTLVEAAPRILGRVACAQTADAIRDLHRRHGVEVIEGTGLSRLTGEGGRVTGAELADGRRIDAEVVLTGIGVAPRTELAEGAGLRIENGIAVDEMCATSAPGVYAAGDCASFPHPGGRMRLESVGGAIDMAEAAAASILGQGVPYVPRPWFWSDQYDVKLQIAGIGAGHDRIVVRRDGAALSHWYFAGERLLAVDALDDPRGYMAGKRLIEAGRSPDPARVADPTVSARDLLAA
ncbi:MAG: NAD(P)/FAD-dependent oxidoreductase [Paracoccaceae bacterium]